MVENGLKLVSKKRHGESIAPDEVGFVFNYDDENTLQWVLSDLVSADVCILKSVYLPRKLSKNLGYLMDVLKREGYTIVSYTVNMAAKIDGLNRNLTKDNILIEEKRL